MAAAARFGREHPAAAGGAAGLSDALKKEKEEVDARVKLLAELDEKYEDLGGCWRVGCAAMSVWWMVGERQAFGHLIYWWQHVCSLLC